MAGTKKKDPVRWSSQRLVCGYYKESEFEWSLIQRKIKRSIAISKNIENQKGGGEWRRGIWVQNTHLKGYKKIKDSNNLAESENVKKECRSGLFLCFFYCSLKINLCIKID